MQQSPLFLLFLILTPIAPSKPVLQEQLLLEKNMGPTVGLSQDNWTGPSERREQSEKKPPRLTCLDSVPVALDLRALCTLPQLSPLRCAPSLASSMPRLLLAFSLVCSATSSCLICHTLLITAQHTGIYLATTTGRGFWVQQRRFGC